MSLSIFNLIYFSINSILSWLRGIQVTRMLRKCTLNFHIFVLYTLQSNKIVTILLWLVNKISILKEKSSMTTSVAQGLPCGRCMTSPEFDCLYNQFREINFSKWFLIWVFWIKSIAFIYLL